MFSERIFSIGISKFKLNGLDNETLCEQVRYFATNPNNRTYGERDMGLSNPHLKLLTDTVLEQSQKITNSILANPNVNYDDAIRNIANLRSALGIITENSSSQGGGISPSSLETLNVQQIIAGTLQTGSDLLTEEPPSSQPIVVPVPVERPAVDRAPSGNGGGGGAYLLPASPTIDILDAVPSYDARMYQGL